MQNRYSLSRRADFSGGGWISKNNPAVTKFD